MRHAFDGYNYLVRFDKNELLVMRLQEFAKEHNIKGGWVSAIGAAQWVQLGYYHLDQHEYEWKKFDQLLEVTALQGTLAWNEGKPMAHLHGTFSDANMQLLGGHVKELEVGATCEVFVHVWNAEQLKRFPDAPTGLKLLEL